MRCGVRIRRVKFCDGFEYENIRSVYVKMINSNYVSFYQIDPYKLN